MAENEKKKRENRNNEKKITSERAGASRRNAADGARQKIDGSQKKGGAQKKDGAQEKGGVQKNGSPQKKADSDARAAVEPRAGENHLSGADRWRKTNAVKNKKDGSQRGVGSDKKKAFGATGSDGGATETVLKDSRVNVRQLVYAELLKAEDEDRYFNRVLDTAIDRYSLYGADRRFFTALLYGVAEKTVTLDHIISRFSNKKTDKLDAAVLAALRLGAYQILYMDRVPDSAACNESVKLVKRKAASAAPFVNAILRRMVREKPDLSFPELSGDPFLRMSVRYSVPIELVQFFCENYGKERAESVLSAFDGRSYLTLRVNTQKTTRDELLRKLEAEGIEAYPTRFAEFGINVAEAVAVSELECVGEGLCYIQGEASQLASATLMPSEGDTVIDMCAAPGGKSFFAAMTMRNRGVIHAFDIHKNKLGLIEREAEKLSLSIITASEGDSSVLRDELCGVADRVICDVPCSGFGVIMKKPDMLASVAERIKSMREGGEDSLPELQYKILCNAAEYLKAGGRLVYSTCTLNKAENEEVVERFLASHEGYRLDRENTRCLFPDPDVEPYRRTDGFFYAAIDKLKD